MYTYLAFEWPFLYLIFVLSCASAPSGVILGLAGVGAYGSGLVEVEVKEGVGTRTLASSLRKCW